MKKSVALAVAANISGLSDESAMDEVKKIGIHLMGHLEDLDNDEKLEALSAMVMSVTEGQKVIDEAVSKVQEMIKEIKCQNQ